ncbi:retrovirus-related pol polyprotein from transposon TNT 1-94 [Tanacetum coccineum]
MSCIPDDIIEPVISCVSSKETWTDLVHSFEGPSDTKENRIMDMKLEYQTFRAKSIESLSQTYTRYKTLLNKLANDGGLRNANHTQTLDLADIYERFVYKENLIQRRYSDTKKALITIPSSTLISTAFFSNNVIQDFQENSDNERASEEYLRDLDIEYHEIVLLANSKHFIKQRNNFSGQKANENTECYKCGNKGHFARDYFSKTSEPSYKSLVNNYSSVSKGFQPKFTSKLIQSSSNSNSQADPKFQKEYKAEYKKMKAKLALLEVSPSNSQNPKTFQPKNKGLVAETFDWDEEEVSDEEEVTQVKVLMALADDEHTVVKNADLQNYLKYINIDLKFVEEQGLNLLSKYNKMVFELNKCRDKLLILKQAKLDIVTFHIQNTELTKLNHALQEQLKEEKKINEKWQTSSKRILYCMICKKEEHRTSDHKMYIASLKRSENYKAQPYQYASSSKHILKAKKKHFPSCTHYGFNDHRPDDYRNYPECEICRSYDHSTSGYNRVIHIRGGVLAESSQSNKSLIGVKCNTCGSTVHSTTKHNEFDHFKRDKKIQTAKAREPTKNGCSRSMTGVKSYLHKYVEQPSPKVVFGDNSSCITEGYGSINCGV